MGNERKINWLSLFIKIVIIFIFALIIVWLISKIIDRNKISKTFQNNINNMEKVSIEYFKTIDLPLDKGQNIKITLEELIKKELIVSTSSESENKCDKKESYSKITRETDKYLIETTLKCGKEKETIKSDFSLENCKNCVQKEKDETLEEDTDSNYVGVTYYEYVKETTSYTKWMRGSLTGNDIENRYEYYGIDYQTYYSLGAIQADKNSITYTLKLDEVPNNRYYFMTIEEVSNYNETETENYLNNEKVSIYNGKTPSLTSKLSTYSLGETNITYKISPYYRNGSFYVRVTINVNNTNGVETYFDNKLQEKIYLIPLKIKIKFASNEISDTKPTGEYETISYYRYVTTNREVKWSTENSIEGYTKTGNTQIK